MNKFIKFGIGSMIVLLLLLVLTAIILGTHLGAVVKAGMETIGPKVTQTTLTVGSVDLSLFNGSGTIKNLLLGNPAGYHALQSISVSNATISLAPGSVLADKIVIHSIEVHAPEITFEGNPVGDNNLNKIMDNVRAISGTADVTAPNTPAPTHSSQPKPAKKLEVDNFIITGAKVHAHINGLINRQITLPLPDIHLTDLGKGDNGITPADLTQKVLAEISTATLISISEYASKFGKNAATLAKNATADWLQGPTNSVNLSTDKLKKNLRGLFGN